MLFRSPSQFWNSIQFRKVQKDWYRRLAKEGFEDIEKDEMLKTWHNVYFQIRHSPEAIEDSARYFNMASEFLNHYQLFFNSELERRIWSLHCEGHGCRTIAWQLQNDNIRINKDYVHWIIRDLKAIMLTVL